MKVIFLDVDGVLIHGNYHNIETENIDSSKITLLKEIVDETESKIVLISNWRVYNQKDDKYLYGFLESELKKQGLSIYDDTPIFKLEVLSLEKDNEKGSYKNIKYNPFSTRGGEIKSWLKNHPDVDNYVIIDDENHFYDYFEFNDMFIRTDKKLGLTKENVLEAINILSQKVKTK